VAQPTLAPTTQPAPGFEAGSGDGKFVFGGSYTLRSGERLSGDLVVFGGDATVESDSRVDGNVVVIGGDVDIAGRVGRDVVLIGGMARLRSSAVVGGQLVRVGGGLQQDEGAQIHGGESGGVTIPPIPPVPPVPSVPRPRVVEWWQFGANSFINFVWHVTRAVGSTILLALLALFVVSLWREPVDRVRQTIANATGVSWVVGFLTPLAFAVIVPAFAVLSAILVLALCLGLVGFVLIAVVSLALAIAWLMGWIALGQIAGERLLHAIGTHDATPAASAAVGTAVITLVWLALEPFCGLGWLFFALSAPLGLGAVILTRFGTQDYGTSSLGGGFRPPAPPAPPVPPTPPIPGPMEPSVSGESPSGDLRPVEPSPSPDAAPPIEPPAPASPLEKPVGEL
jgi:hypothetical protein